MSHPTPPPVHSPGPKFPPACKSGAAFSLFRGDCLEVLKQIPDSSVDLVLTDPPYYRVKSDAWDRQWDTRAGFLAWLDQVVEQLARVMKPNGSLYLFASPQMAAHVEVKLSERLEILNHIVWQKPGGIHRRQNKESQRAFFPQTERILFAEQVGADNLAKMEAGYLRECDAIRGRVFEPLRAYLAAEWDRAGLTPQDANLATGSQMSSHWLSPVQWYLPTPKRYEQLRTYANRSGGNYLARPHDELVREYEALLPQYLEERRSLDGLKAHYEALRRPFQVSKEVPCTDVWVFNTVQSYPGKHPCEKPQDLLRHMVAASSRPGAVVLDCFMGGGSTGEACLDLGRRFIGIEMGEKYFQAAAERLEKVETRNQGAATP